jgi:tetratricopeptide (TPR) repeat protein
VLTKTLQEGNLAPAEQLELNLRLAAMYQHMSELPLAEGAVQAGLLAVPDDASAMATLAWVLLDEKRLPEAQAAAETAAERRAGWPAYYVLGEVALQTCRVPEAIQAFQTGLTYPVSEYRFYWQWLRLGDAYWEAGQTADAIASWQTYIQLQPSSPAAAAKIDQAKHAELSRTCSAQ